jgi:hypothetical protein
VKHILKWNGLLSKPTFYLGHCSISVCYIQPFNRLSEFIRQAGPPFDAGFNLVVCSIRYPDRVP